MKIMFMLSKHFTINYPNKGMLMAKNIIYPILSVFKCLIITAQ
jgi:hypothetical protein